MPTSVVGASSSRRPVTRRTVTLRQRRRGRDPKIPPREELPRLHPRGGHRNGALFSGAISGHHSLPSCHCYPLGVRISLFQVFLLPLPILITLHRLFLHALLLLYYRAPYPPTSHDRTLPPLY